MPLTVITGRANAGKTGLLYDVVRGAASRGERPVVLLPSRPDVRRAAEEFAARGPLLGAETATFEEYIDSLWGLFGDGRRIVGDTQRRVLLGRVVAEAELAVLKSSATRRGFVRMLEKVVRSLGAMHHSSARRGTVAGEIAAVVGAYEKLLLDEGLAERSVATTLLARSVKDDWFSGPLVANRFTDLTAPQELFLVAASRSADVWLSLPWEDGFAATRTLDGLVARLAEAGATVRPIESGNHTHSAELAYLESHLFLPPDQALGAPRLGDVRLSGAFGEEAESDRIAAEVLDALAEGVSPSRIAVVFHEPARHVRTLRRAFAAAEIAADFDVLERATQTGWGRALVHLVDFGIRGSRSDLLAFVRTQYSGVIRSSAERAEAHWRRTRVVSREDLIADLGRLGGEAPRIIRLAAALAREPVTMATVSEWQNLADYLFRSGASHVNGSAADVTLDAAAHRGFMRVLAEAASLPGAAFTARELLDTFDGERVAVLADHAGDRVQVMSAQRARSRRFDVVIVGGLVAGDFPPRRADDALSSLELSAALCDMGADLRRSDDQDAQRLLFYLVVSRATHRLVLSRQISDSDGRELRASWLLEELLDLYRPPGVDDCEDVLPPTRTLGFEDSGLARAAPRTGRRAIRECAVSGAPTPDTDAEARLLRARRRSGARTGTLVDQRALALLGQREVYSVTEIEAYLGCPYSWFYERLVRARPLGEEVDALLTGRLVHSALERFYGLLRERTGDERVTTANLTQAAEIATDAVAEVLSNQPDPETIREQAAFVAVREKVRGFVQAEAVFLPGFAPCATEVAFDSTAMSLGVSDDFGLRGRIDRIDRGPGGQLVVIDYKTGRVDSTYAQAAFEKRGRVQLPLYASIAARLLGEPVVGGFYRQVSPRNLRDKMNRGFYDPEQVDGPGLVSTDRADASEIDNLVAEALARAARAVAGMRAGEIAPQPVGPHACAYCSARKFCGGALA